MIESEIMLTKTKKLKVVKEAKVHDSDTGSPEVQVSILTKRIEELSRHLKKNNKDIHSRRGLLGLVAKRQKQMNYLMKKNPPRYKSLMKKLNLKAKN